MLPAPGSENPLTFETVVENGGTWNPNPVSCLSQHSIHQQGPLSVAPLCVAAFHSWPPQSDYSVAAHPCPLGLLVSKPEAWKDCRTLPLPRGSESSLRQSTSPELPALPLAVCSHTPIPSVCSTCQFPKHDLKIKGMQEGKCKPQAQKSNGGRANAKPFSYPDR